MKNMGFKNAPFPRLEKETDLMVGMEGQLGVVPKLILIQLETKQPASSS